MDPKFYRKTQEIEKIEKSLTNREQKLYKEYVFSELDDNTSMDFGLLVFLIVASTLSFIGLISLLNALI